MMKILINNIKRFLASFFFAFCGINRAIRTERNFRFHLSFAIMVISLGFVASISDIEFIAVILCIILVIGFELINTSVERLCDIIDKKKNENIKAAKDCAAGAVLVSAFLSAIIGLKIFLKSEYIKAIFHYFSKPSSLIILIVYVVAAFVFVFLPDNKKE